MNVRAATADDVPAVLPMVAKICAMHETLDPRRYAFLPNIVEMYKAWLPQRAQDPRSIFLVAEGRARSSLAGFLIGMAERDIPIYRTPEFGFIHDVWVEPEYRRGGVAGRLVDMAVQRFEAMGMKQVRLETAAANETARRLFAAHRFRVGTVDMVVDLPPGSSSLNAPDQSV